MEDECLARTPSGGDFDERLQQLAIEAKQQPPLSPQRQLLLNRLVNKILQSDRLSHPQRGSWPSSLYEDLYNEAMQKTLLEICQKIDNYNPAHPVMAWVNYLLGMRFRDVVRRYLNQGITNVPQSTLNERVISLSELEYSLISEEQTMSDSQLLGRFLEDDPENLLKNEHIRGHPQASFQYIAIARFVEEKTWEEISTELNDISIQTLYSFFNRQLRKLMPYFQKYL
ncbi:MAG: sigma-70 family RNA polymerase sigma factor [Cyanobacteriota bacterium]|nr:sigma-70 family RNA polymerase sigma factor [Cyanobacteriota bacterium]